MATLTEVAGRCKITLSYASALVRRGVITKRDRGQYDLDEAHDEYVRNLRLGAAGRDSESGLSKERARLASEQADAQALKNEVERGLLVERAEVIRQVATEYSILRERLLGIPGKIADVLDDRQRARVEKEIVEALSGLSNPTRGGFGGGPQSGTPSSEAAA